jgi:hypothetical protein
VAKNEIRLREAYDHLVKINRDTFSVGEFNVTYHALMAAMHCAGTLRDIEGLSEVERLAREELA